MRVKIGGKDKEKGGKKFGTEINDQKTQNKT
jgi:hypothetical protein